jgi:hypothetical protein
VIGRVATTGAGHCSKKVGGAPGSLGRRIAEGRGLSRLDQDSVGAKILKLEEVIGGQLEAEGHTLAKAVAEHVLTCF